MAKSERRIEVKAMLPPTLVAKAKAVAKGREISYSEFVEEALIALLFQEFLNDTGKKPDTPIDPTNFVSGDPDATDDCYHPPELALLPKPKATAKKQA